MEVTFCFKCRTEFQLLENGSFEFFNQPECALNQMDDFPVLRLDYCKENGARCAIGMFKVKSEDPYHRACEFWPVSGSL